MVAVYGLDSWSLNEVGVRARLDSGARITPQPVLDGAGLTKSNTSLQPY